MPWGFYGRSDELQRLKAILARNRWDFVKITGRRRIGKTTLIQRALQGGQKVFYVQVPDSGPVGVLSAVSDAMETFEIPTEFPRPRSLGELARLVGALAHAEVLPGGVRAGEGAGPPAHFHRSRARAHSAP